MGWCAGLAFSRKFSLISCTNSSTASTSAASVCLLGMILPVVISSSVFSAMVVAVLNFSFAPKITSYVCYGF